MDRPNANAEIQPDIPPKLYFRIGEASRLVGVAPYVLRYWETEFPALAPKKSGAGHRYYRRKDVELLLQIKHLLYDRRFTIEGARQHLQGQARGKPRDRLSTAGQPGLFAPGRESWEAIRRELTSLLDLLK